MSATQSERTWERTGSAEIAWVPGEDSISRDGDLSSSGGLSGSAGKRGSATSCSQNRLYQPPPTYQTRALTAKAWIKGMRTLPCFLQQVLGSAGRQTLSPEKEAQPVLTQGMRSFVMLSPEVPDQPGEDSVPKKEAQPDSSRLRSMSCFLQRSRGSAGRRLCPQRRGSARLIGGCGAAMLSPEVPGQPGEDSVPRKEAQPPAVLR